jgi:hypothetical protein
MSNPFSVEPPSWLQRRATIGYEEALQTSGEVGQMAGAAIGSGIQAGEGKGNFFQLFSDSMNRVKDSMWDFKKKNALLTLQSNELGLQEKQLQIQGQTQEFSAQREDAPIWMQYQSDALKDPTTPQPAWQSQKYQTMGQQFVWKQQAEELQKQKIQTTLDAAKIKADTDRQRIDAMQSIAAANNKSRETIANLKKQADEGFTPKEIPFGNATLIQLGPHHWQYVRGEVAKVMTPDKLQAFANGLSDENPNKAFLLKAAEVAAVKQVTGNKSASTSAATPKPDDLVTVINPSGKHVKIKKSDLDDALKQGYQQP